MVWSNKGVYRNKAILLIFLAVIIIYLCYSIVTDDDYFKTEYWKRRPSYKTKKYLISTSKCRIPDTDPFSDEIKQFIVKENYMECSKLRLLTYIEKTDGVAVLKINASLLPLYSSLEITCCYSEIIRINYIHKPDDQITYSACKEFHNQTTVSYPFIKVYCTTAEGKVYANTHAIILPNTPEKTATINDNKTNRYSILLIGIDSISKQNLVRTMPKTHSYLEKNLINLKGFNKIGDNTFPNLMAMLTGQSETHLEGTCNRSVKANKCPIIWNTFKSFGYATAYAEDETNIATFHYLRPGFSDPPTDHYFRPYMIASEELGAVMRHRMTFCAGPETSGERILNLAKDFSVTYENTPSFGLFWMNSFSHDNINIASAMDEKVLDFLSDASFKASLNDTVMMFFSDHGFRFGNIRYTHTGWLEERLPFIYFHIPDSFKVDYPGKYKNFLINTERLTTPYDIYTTFQDILAIGNLSYEAKGGLGCPKCNSLFEEVAESRTCEQGGIDQNWCTCTGHSYINPRNGLVKKVAEFILKEINAYIKTFPQGHSCLEFALKKVVAAGKSEAYLNDRNKTVYYFLIMIETSPRAMFEATVEGCLELERSEFRLVGDISRINRYSDNSFCVDTADLKKYCYCYDGVLGTIKRFFV